MLKSLICLLKKKKKYILLKYIMTFSNFNSNTSPVNTPIWFALKLSLFQNKSEFKNC